MRRLLGGLLGLLLLLGCNDTPNGIIPKKRMVGVLTDLHLIEGYLISIPQDSMRQVARQYYQTLYDKYGTDSAGLHESIHYYSNNPTAFDEVYEKVQAQLAALEQQEQAKMDAKMREQAVADSIRGVKLMDSTRRAALDAARLKWSGQYLLADSNLVDSSARAWIDTVSAQVDSLGGTDQQRLWLAQQDFMMQFFGNSKWMLPFLSGSFITVAPSSNVRPAPRSQEPANKERTSKEKAIVPMPMQLEDKPIAAPKLQPSRTPGIRGKQNEKK